MEYEIFSVFMRPSVDVPWFLDTVPSSHFEYVKTKYMDTGKLVGKKEEFGDGLFVSFRFTFPSEEAKQEFINDEYMQEMLIKRTIYNETNGIVQIS